MINIECLLGTSLIETVPAVKRESESHLSFWSLYYVTYAQSHKPKQNAIFK